MISYDDQKTFELYYQKAYDFNTSSLSDDEVNEIKRLALEKRVNYSLAPLGKQVFNFISEQSVNIDFEVVELENDKIDGMLYIPQKGDDRAYIIINGKKPLVNQIFAAAHEYYHYIQDYEKIKKKPYICCLSSLQTVNEKRASRFAAEFLLPEGALTNETKLFCKRIEKTYRKSQENLFSFEEVAVFGIILSVKYQMPLKAVLYRLYEERIIGEIDYFIENYAFIKNVLLQIEILKPLVDELYSSSNKYLGGNTIIYNQMEKTYKNGYATRDEIIEDAKTLGLNMEIIQSYFEDITYDDGEEDDSDLLELVQPKYGGKKNGNGVKSDYVI